MNCDARAERPGCWLSLLAVSSSVTGLSRHFCPFLLVSFFLSPPPPPHTPVCSCVYACLPVCLHLYLLPHPLISPSLPPSLNHLPPPTHLKEAFVLKQVSVDRRWEHPGGEASVKESCGKSSCFFLPAVKDNCPLNVDRGCIGWQRDLGSPTDAGQVGLAKEDCEFGKTRAGKRERERKPGREGGGQRGKQGKKTLVSVAYTLPLSSPFPLLSRALSLFPALVSQSTDRARYPRVSMSHGQTNSSPSCCKKS